MTTETSGVSNRRIRRSVKLGNLMDCSAEGARRILCPGTYCQLAEATSKSLGCCPTGGGCSEMMLCCNLFEVVHRTEYLGGPTWEVTLLRVADLVRRHKVVLLSRYA